MKMGTLWGVALLASMAAAISPPSHAAAPNWGAELPVPTIPGYAFPEAEDTILGWVNGNNTANIYLHGWGVWDALNSPSGLTVYGVPNAPVYLTWVTRQDLINASQATTFAASVQSTQEVRQFHLGEITQLKKFGIHTLAPKILPNSKLKSGIVPDFSELETVTYSPEAGQTIYNGGLFKLATIQQIFNNKQTEIPAFPVNAVVVKPVYKLISASKLYQSRYFVMPAWPGTPSVTPQIQKKGFPEQSWGAGCVYVDTLNQGATTASAVDSACTGPTVSTTYGLGDFVHFNITGANAPLFDVDNPAQKTTVKPGDTLLLMAMHVSTREITEWTWQSFFWTPNAAAPPSPSSSTMAGAIPAQLTGSPAHYAATFAYQMVNPNQPVNGGTSTGGPIIGYNPYLEAGFPASTFGISRPITPTNGGAAWTGTVGIQTNCMTCHSLASVSFVSKTALPNYGTDFYIARDDPAFANTVQTEFLWSIADIVGNQQQSLKAKSKGRNKNKEQ